MKTNKLSVSFVETYKNAIDCFGGPIGISNAFGWSLSVVYKWMSGNVMGLSYALCINAKLPKFTLKSLIGYELECERVYIKVLAHFGNQNLTAKALGVSQFTVHTWLKSGGRISLPKAELLEKLTRGKFHPSDFSHLK